MCYTYKYLINKMRKFLKAKINKLKFTLSGDINHAKGMGIIIAIHLLQ